MPKIVSFLYILVFFFFQFSSCCLASFGALFLLLCATTIWALHLRQFASLFCLASVSASSYCLCFFIFVFSFPYQYLFKNNKKKHFIVGCRIAFLFIICGLTEEKRTNWWVMRAYFMPQGASKVAPSVARWPADATMPAPVLPQGKFQSLFSY